MYTGQVDVISNKATWASKTYELFDPDDSTTTDLTDPTLTVDIVVTIKGPSSIPYGDYDNSPLNYGTFAGDCVLVTASIANGKVTIPGPGFQWQFEVADLSCLCAGTYRLGAKVTINGFVSDVIDGTITVIRGN